MASVRQRLKQRSASIAAPFKVTIPEVGDVWIRKVTVADADRIAALSKEDGEKRMMARGAAMVICEEDGTPAYDPLSDADLDELSELDLDTLTKITRASQRGNAMSAEGVAEQGKDSPIGKNS